jgi:hypothetical protein
MLDRLRAIVSSVLTYARAVLAALREPAGVLELRDQLQATREELSDTRYALRRTQESLTCCHDRVAGLRRQLIERGTRRVDEVRL